MGFPAKVCLEVVGEGFLRTLEEGEAVPRMALGLGIRVNVNRRRVLSGTLEAPYIADHKHHLQGQDFPRYQTFPEAISRGLVEQANTPTTAPNIENGR